MLLLYLILTALVGLITYFVLRTRKKLNHWQTIGIPCDEPHFIFGSFKPSKDERTFGDIFIDYYNKYKDTGPFAGLYWFQQPGVIVLDPTLIKNVLIKDFNKFTDRGFYTNTKDDPLTGHLFMLDGQKWRNMRMKLSPTFTSGKMKTMFPIIIEVGEEFEKVVGEMVEKDPIIEVKDIAARFTADVIGSCAFGIQCNSLKDPNTQFHIMGRKVFSEQRHGDIVNVLITNFQDAARKLHMKLTPEHIEKFFMNLIRDTVQQREESKIRRNDFMDMLIDLKNNKMMKSENGEELTNITFDELAAQAFVFLVAGFETSSTTMGYALYELAQHEDIQEKAREEICEALERHDQKFTYECMTEMEYLDQMISEILRLYTLFPVLNRVCSEDYVVDNNPKYVIKKGMQVVIPANAIHRDEKYYPNPNEFNPDNFSPEKVKERDIIEWLPFGSGPRNCIGMRFGQMQTRIGLAILLKNFKFSVCEKTQIPLVFDKKSFFMNSKEGIYLKVEKVQ